MRGRRISRELHDDIGQQARHCGDLCALRETMARGSQALASELADIVSQLATELASSIITVA